MWLQSILVWVTLDDSVSNCKHSRAWETKVMNISSWLLCDLMRNSHSCPGCYNDFLAGQSQHSRSLTVIAHCYSPHTKRNTGLRVRGDSITMATREVVPSVPWMGNEILYFSWRMRLRAATCCSPAVEGSHYPVNKAKSRRRVKCWPMRCLRLRRIPTSEALKKQR